MTEYVLGLKWTKDVCYSQKEYGIFILKDRPAWQAGKLNLPGGKIEEGETPEQAMRREFLEEIGLEADEFKKYGVLRDRNFVIHCFSIGWLRNNNSVLLPDLRPRAGETEKPMWLELKDAMNDARLMPNLRVIIPLLQCKIEGWEILDSACPNYQKFHTLSVTVPTYTSL
jgi:mutator protein MutT